MGFVAASPSYSNKEVDEMGNMMANMNSDSGSGEIEQGSDGNAGNDMYQDHVIQNGTGTMNVNAVAGNEEASLNGNANEYNVKQLSDGNNDADKVKNSVETGNGYSLYNFNVANMLGKTDNTQGNTTVQQVRDNNDASNAFVNE